MNGREMAVLSLVVFGVVAIVIAYFAHRRHRNALEQRRLALLEKALQHASLDETTRTELLRTFAESRATRSAAAIVVKGGNWWPTLWFGAGWFLFVINACLMAAEAMDITRGVEIEVVLTLALIGFAMLTLPAALRELTRRSGEAPVRR